MIINKQGEIEAFAFVSNYETNFILYNLIHIDDICVHDKKKGFVKLLLSTIISKVKNRLAKIKENPKYKNLSVIISLHSVENAVNFYKKMGFKPNNNSYIDEMRIEIE
jgi:GNAT superfamily N-acetyltransferase